MDAEGSNSIEVESNGVRLAAEQRGRGEGTPLLCIMGMSGSRTHWRGEFLDVLGRDRPLILFDNRGVGESGRVEEAFTMEQMAADSVAVLDAFDRDRADVFGVSMGGMVAQQLVLADPDRVGKLVLGCTYAGGPEGELTPPETAERIQAGWSSGSLDQILRTFWEINVSESFAAAAEEFERFREVALASRAAMRVIQLQLGAIGGHETAGRLAEIDSPTLVVHGTEDQMLPDVNGERIAAAIPGARLELLEDVGHMFWWERPLESAELIVDFLG